MARRAQTVRRLERATGDLAQAAVQRMDETLPWYRAMSAEDRSWVGLVAQAGIAAFVDWYRRPDGQPTVTAEVFGTAPRELARSVTLQQTVEMIRATIGTVELRVDQLAPSPPEAADLREAVLLYSREIAFAAAQVYAQAAESRGAWDARIEALVVDAVLRGEVDDAVVSRAAAIGWSAARGVCAVLGQAPDASPDEVTEAVQRSARHARLQVVAGIQGDRLVVLVAGAEDPLAAADAVCADFGPGPVVVGSVAPDLAGASRSAAEALAALRAAAAWPALPRPASADLLLPERALDGDPLARRRLVESAYRPLAAAGGDLLETVGAYLDQGGSLEGAARALFVHPNTVRYRLRRVAEVSGFAPTDARGAYTLRIACGLGRLADLEETSKSAP